MGDQADALLERVVGSAIGSAELMNIYLGDRLGLYAPLGEGWLTSGDLASTRLPEAHGGRVRSRRARGGTRAPQRRERWGSPTGSGSTRWTRPRPIRARATTS
jgi:hypothetical protein